MKTKSCLSYFGSDSEVAADLAAMLNHCKHVTIPFVGGASIIPHLTARTILANDLNNEAINFYRVISGCRGEEAKRDLIFRCEHTLSHPAEALAAKLTLAELDSPHIAASFRAWAYWVTCWLPRKGRGGTKSEGGEPSVRYTPEGGNNASRLRSVAADLEAWAEHFRRCEWLCKDFRPVLEGVRDLKSCGIYVDAPWVKAGAAYKHTFKKQDHVDLADALHRFTKATVVIRYDDHPLVRELYSPGYFDIQPAVSRDQCNVIKGELWIRNRIVNGV